MADRRGGRTQAAIAERLNTEAVPTACVGTWYAASVRRALQSASLGW
ncbi:MAG TPA: hypothetical protein VNH38_00905 [Candidatus Dormibacteraeota bacterium]|nr:hypothetical protein [Candidatus Dormibacteraeota bacterium]